MALDRSSLRTDLGYLSRRRKPATPSAAATPAGTTAQAAPAQGPATPGPASLSLAPSSLAPSSPVPASPGGLTLRGSRPEAAPAAPPPSAASAPGPRHAPVPGPAVKAPPRVFPAPALGEVRQLGAGNPLVRLNARQSAIGSLLVTGARSVAWEDKDLITGARHADGHVAGTPVNTPGNRPLVGIEDSAGVVSLRHVGLLRRALFIAGEAPLTIGVFDGAAAALAARDEAGQRSVLYAARIGAVLELRAESVPADASDAAIWAMFGFTMTIPLDHRALRR